MKERELESTLNPQDLAQAYDRFVSARWRGEDDAAEPIAIWFEAHWSGQAPPEPDDPPAGASVLGGSGRGIRWYARDDVVLGYIPGRNEGCYVVETAEAVPTFTAPWDADNEETRYETTRDRRLAPEPAGTGVLLADRVLNQISGGNQSGSSSSF